MRTDYQKRFGNLGNVPCPVERIFGVVESDNLLLNSGGLEKFQF
jgi:hypothetical protein